jgi:hypothetical protein
MGRLSGYDRLTWECNLFYLIDLMSKSIYYVVIHRIINIVIMSIVDI